MKWPCGETIALQGVTASKQHERPTVRRPKVDEAQIPFFKARTPSPPELFTAIARRLHVIV